MKAHAFPGAVLAVGRKNSSIILPVGRLSYAKDATQVQSNTIYDLASITKVVATTTAAMLLVDRGLLELDRPVGHYLEEFTRPFDIAIDPLWLSRNDVTVRHLLAHTSGLPAYERFFLNARNKSHMLEESFALPLEDLPGRKTVYSDIGFILLGEILELVAKQPLDVFFQTEIASSLAMADTQFNPPTAILGRIAPTEQDETFRKRLIRGEVHDENAWVMEGVAGHSGLFGTAEDLSLFCRMMLCEGKISDKQFLQLSTIREFTKYYPAEQGAPRGLGWDKPSEPSASGRYFSASSYGHLGYTGTSLWIDPEKDLFIILLTNRVHPSRENEMIKTIRPSVHDAVVEAM